MCLAIEYRIRRKWTVINAEKNVAAARCIKCHFAGNVDQQRSFCRFGFLNANHAGIVGGLKSTS